MEELKVKVVAVGDGAVGKSCLVRSLEKESPDLHYVPTVFETILIQRTIQGVQLTMTWWDTAGQEDYDRLRPLNYPQTDVFLLCFSVENLPTLENISSKWHTEVWHHCPGVPVILVGLKSDLRRKASPLLVCNETAVKMAKKLDAFCYVECSADTMEGMDQLVEQIFLCVKKKGKRRTSHTTKCCVLT